MLQINAAFSGFSVNDLNKAKVFYSDVLGLKLKDEKMGLEFELPGGGRIFIYDKPDHKPADYTILNLVVNNIDEAVEALGSQGIHFEHYNNMPTQQDDKEIMRGLAANQGPDIAWFKDPAGNILSLLQVKSAVA